MTVREGFEVDTLTIRIPMRLQRRAGRKLIMTPEGAAAPARKPRRDETLIKALVRAHRWRRRIESGQAKSITDPAEQEGVTDAYVCRLLPLTCLAPDIVEAILDGRQPNGLRLAEVLGERAARIGGAKKRLRLPSELCAGRLAQEVAAPHLAPAGFLDDLHDLSHACRRCARVDQGWQPRSRRLVRRRNNDGRQRDPEEQVR
jgi:hypothetical protein